MAKQKLWPAKYDECPTKWSVLQRAGMILFFVLVHGFWGTFWTFDVSLLFIWMRWCSWGLCWLGSRVLRRSCNGPCLLKGKARHIHWTHQVRPSHPCWESELCRCSKLKLYHVMQVTGFSFDAIAYVISTSIHPNWISNGKDQMKTVRDLTQLSINPSAIGDTIIKWKCCKLRLS